MLQRELRVLDVMREEFVHKLGVVGDAEGAGGVPAYLEERAHGRFARVVVLENVAHHPNERGKERGRKEDAEHEVGG